MYNGLSEDWIVLDTNIFLHSLHDNKKARRIKLLLNFLWKNSIALLIDDKMVIIKEYYRHLSQQFKNKPEQNSSMVRVLRLLDSRNLKAVKLEDYRDLQQAIRRCIPEGADKVFVGVAFAKGRILVTNDKPLLAKREQLLSSTKQSRNRLHRSGQNSKDKSDILCSDTAEARTRSHSKKREIDENGNRNT